MDPLAIVEARYILEDFLLSFLASFELLEVNQFFLQDTMKGFYASIVVAVSLSTHATLHLVFLEQILILR
jgi:hypothetical protein